MNSTIFTAHCQTWLDDPTRLQVTHGLCQPEIKKWHRLTVTSCSLPNGLTGLLIIPQFLLTVTQAACVEELHLLLPATLKKWINTRQKEFNGLSALTEDYIRATRPL